MGYSGGASIHSGCKQHAQKSYHSEKMHFSYGNWWNCGES
ncbi:hypothetical protein GCM10007884_51410 [Methylobacterium brachythecii]|uniref:Uncharacterized protein n=1 Tax=Methylobacterium brachythecii TaxID=1176177 RepID=A0ABQ6DCA6_9HYPH|nr:hypothetical protein GCM10007884_51410 [Methylobacterium brachythecii]